MELLSGRSLYERVLREGVAGARVSVWIATANLKELLVEPAHLALSAPGERYVSVFRWFAELVRRGVEVRILHSGVPSTAFSHELIAHRSLLTKRAGTAEGGPGLALRRCPRVHFKTVVIDAAQLYLGSANWTGAGLGAKGEGRRNFEVGFLSREDALLDEVQALYDRVWTGAACKGCRLKSECPAPLDGSVPPERLVRSRKRASVGR